MLSRSRRILTCGALRGFATGANNDGVPRASSRVYKWTVSPSAQFYSFDTEYRWAYEVFPLPSSLDPRCCLYVHGIPDDPAVTEGVLCKLFNEKSSIVPTGIRRIKMVNSKKGLRGRTIVLFRSQRHRDLALKSLPGASGDDEYGMPSKRVVVGGSDGLLYCYVREFSEYSLSEKGGSPPTVTNRIDNVDSRSGQSVAGSAKDPTDIAPPEEASLNFPSQADEEQQLNAPPTAESSDSDSSDESGPEESSSSSDSDK